MFACGFESGCVQLFDMTSSLIEYRSVGGVMVSLDNTVLNIRHHHGAITGLQFTSTGYRLYSSSCDSTLAMYNVGSFKLLKLLGNTVVMGMVGAPGTIALDHDDNKLAVVGPLAHTITIMDPDNLNEVGFTIILLSLLTVSLACKVGHHSHSHSTFSHAHCRFHCCS